MVGKPRIAGRRAVGDPYDQSFALSFHRLTLHLGALDTHHREVAAYREELHERAHKVAYRFGLNWRALSPKDLDVLSWAVPAGDHWRWDGWTNNRGCPVIRLHASGTKRTGPGNSDHSVNPILHRLFVPGHPPPFPLRQRCGAEFICVRPEHRCKVCSGRYSVRHVDSGTYARLPSWQRQQADSIAAILRSGSVGAYSGSESDALTDATSIVLAAPSAPPTGDNHNAALCPYCSPPPATADPWDLSDGDPVNHQHLAKELATDLGTLPESGYFSGDQP